ncbi:hypothetical protein AALA44_08580 [Enterococcus ratti]|uniref:hypothetical protein n=1 Tax=Enterococcus ratti TaxID=150033 RepID=UPI003515EE9D
MDNKIKEKMNKEVNKARKNYTREKDKYGLDMRNIFYQKWNLLKNNKDVNYGNEYNYIVEFMYLYKKAIEKHPEQFKDRKVEKLKASLENSIGCSYNTKYFKSCMKALENNNPDSFLIIPISYFLMSNEEIVGHSVSLVIQKEEDKIKIKVCNKGGQLVPNEKPSIDENLTEEKFYKLAKLAKWDRWNNLSNTEKSESYNNLTESEKLSRLNDLTALEKLWIDSKSKQLRPIYVYEFKETKENIKNISKAIRIGQLNPRLKDLRWVHLFRNLGLRILLFKDKYRNLLHYDTRIEYPLNKLHRHAEKSYYLECAANSQILGNCGIKNLSMAFKYALGEPQEEKIKGQTFVKYKQVKNLDKMLIEAAKEELKDVEFDKFVDDIKVEYSKKKAEFSILPVETKMKMKKLYVKIAQEQTPCLMPIKHNEIYEKVHQVMQKAESKEQSR